LEFSNVPFQHKHGYIRDERSLVRDGEVFLPSEGRLAIY